jgi:hypothetical protein
VKAALSRAFPGALVAAQNSDAWIMQAESPTLLAEVPSEPEWTAQTGPDFGFEGAFDENASRLGCVLRKPAVP